MMDIKQILEALHKLEESRDLLRDVHLQVGGYGNGKIYPKTLKAINEFFGFDDSRDID